MPILAYFTVVGALLTGLLFAADAYLPATSPAIASSNFTGLPPAWKGPVQQAATVPVPAPEPDMNSAAVRAASPAQAEPAKTEPAQVAHANAPAPIKRKKIQPRHEPEWHNHFASGWSQPQPGWGQNNWQQNRRPVESRRAQQSPQNSFWR